MLGSTTGLNLWSTISFVLFFVIDFSYPNFFFSNAYTSLIILRNIIFNGSFAFKYFYFSKYIVKITNYYRCPKRNCFIIKKCRWMVGYWGCYLTSKNFAGKKNKFFFFYFKPTLRFFLVKSRPDQGRSRAGFEFWKNFKKLKSGPDQDRIRGISLKKPKRRFKIKKKKFLSFRRSFMM